MNRMRTGCVLATVLAAIVAATGCGSASSSNTMFDPVATTTCLKKRPEYIPPRPFKFSKAKITMQVAPLGVEVDPYTHFRERRVDLVLFDNDGGTGTVFHLYFYYHVSFAQIAFRRQHALLGKEEKEDSGIYFRRVGNVLMLADNLVKPFTKDPKLDIELATTCLRSA
jgi:hypothetical protein